MEENKNFENSNRGDDNKSDAAKLVDKHMQDPNHIISEEDMKEIKVGVVHNTDAPTEQAIKDAEDKIADKKADSNDEESTGGQKMTPWDTINP